MSRRSLPAPVRVATRRNLAPGHCATADALGISACPSPSVHAKGPGAAVSK